MGASERIRAFLDLWEEREYGESIYGLGDKDGIQFLKVSDIREVLDGLGEDDGWECTDPPL